MKATAEPIPEAAAVRSGWWSIFSELVKLRLTTLVMLTTLVGFYLGERGPVNYGLLFHTLLGTALVACGAAALNQLLERELDAKMRRTEGRPLPSGRLQPDSVLIMGGLSAILGLLYLAWMVNLLTSVLGAVTLGSYLFVYTPLKRVTTLNTVIGAIPGALPPLMVWTASRDYIDAGGWSLFAILFFWQLPHFMAIAWMYREDYARAGFRMLPVVDPEGVRTGRQTISHTLGLLAISLFPAVFGVVGTAYLIGALAASLWLLWHAIRFARDLSVARARKLFYASILYLPWLLGLMVLDKVK